MPRDPSHPIAFAAGEALADGATVALVVWEVAGTVRWRTFPSQSMTVLVGLHDMIGSAIDQMRGDQEGGTDDDAES